jgi:hypothetical protein
MDFVYSLIFIIFAVENLVVHFPTAYKKPNNNILIDDIDKKYLVDLKTKQYVIL